MTVSALLGVSMSRQDHPVEDPEKYHKRLAQLREAKRRQRARDREQRLRGATHHERSTEKTVAMTVSTASPLTSMAQMEGVTQGALIERPLLREAKRKHPPLHSKWEKPFWG
jgi:hypothetical protein